MNYKNLISVIVPTFNRAGFLSDSLHSISNQTYENHEIIVVDDGSTDNTKEVIQKINHPKIKYIYQQNRGPAAAKNAGIKAASGNLISFLDSDDLWPEEKLELQNSKLESSQSYDIVMGGVKHKELSGKGKNTFVDVDETYNRNSLGSGLFRANVFKTTGMFNEDLIHWEDLDWLMRAAENGVKTLKHRDITLIVRIHKNNMSRDQKSSKKYLSRVLKDSLERRRRKNNGTVNKIILSQWTRQQ